MKYPVTPTAMMILRATFQFTFTVDVHMPQAHFCNFGSLLSFATTDHEC
jgi:hypothetical protein